MEPFLAAATDVRVVVELGEPGTAGPPATLIPGTDPQLARTGMDTMFPIVLALLLVLAGMTLLSRQRRWEHDPQGDHS